MRGMARLPCAFSGARPAGVRPELVVVHGISLPPGRFGGDAVCRLFAGTLDFDAHPYFARLRGRELSAHFFLRRDGAAAQFVSVARRAFHAGESVWRGRRACNDFSVGVELEGEDEAPYETAQYEALARVVAALARRWPRLAVCGHCHVAPGRKTDPGAAFDWAALFGRIGWGCDGRV